eukprot:CAMPEP_0179406372 /NCGR_PEP_ID=MMETSP0799-20121207/849_1 /TAXON_ID=46947 /ORGANISM="Geminigera cryophila, Strain CCMP2564" /LENGTH=87 /DNA_ID=CAMNT_0021177411 /DNA_START=250 /DNA_END=510 /DNA_ORIENTATION=+
MQGTKRQPTPSSTHPLPPLPPPKFARAAGGSFEENVGGELGGANDEGGGVVFAEVDAIVGTVHAAMTLSVTLCSESSAGSNGGSNVT